MARGKFASVDQVINGVGTATDDLYSALNLLEEKEAEFRNEYGKFQFKVCIFMFTFYSLVFIPNDFIHSGFYSLLLFVFL